MHSNKHIKRPDYSQGNKVKLSVVSTKTKEDLTPVFCFKYLQADYDIESCTKEERAIFLKKLGLLSQIPWDQITTSRRQGHGSERIDVTNLKISLPSCISEDVTEILSFHLNGISRFLALREEENVMRIYFIDPHGKTYSHSHK